MSNNIFSWVNFPKHPLYFPHILLHILLLYYHIINFVIDYLSHFSFLLLENLPFMITNSNEQQESLRNVVFHDKYIVVMLVIFIHIWDILYF